MTKQLKSYIAGFLATIICPVAIGESSLTDTGEATSTSILVNQSSAPTLTFSTPPSITLPIESWAQIGLLTVTPAINTQKVLIICDDSQADTLENANHPCVKPTGGQGPVLAVDASGVEYLVNGHVPSTGETATGMYAAAIFSPQAGPVNAILRASEAYNGPAGTVTYTIKARAVNP